MVGERELVGIGVVLVVLSLFVGFVTPVGEKHSTMWADPAENERDSIPVAELPAECRAVGHRLADGQGVSEDAYRAWIGGRWSYLDPSWGWASGEGRWLVVERTNVSGGWEFGGPVCSDAIFGPGSVSVDGRSYDVYRSGSFHWWDWLGKVGVAFAVAAGALFSVVLYRWLRRVDVYAGP